MNKSFFITLFFCCYNVLSIFAFDITYQFQTLYGNKPRLIELKEELFVKDSVYAYVQNIKPGAERLELYKDLLNNKRVGIFSNQTSVLRSKNFNTYSHLVDTLLEEGIDIKKVFVPEHGLFGNIDAGERVGGWYDSVRHLSIISLYGSNKKPSDSDLKDIDVFIFDIQDVGVRFYTYISSLQYILEACIKNKKTLVVLDRPNPNGFYVDGPVLDKNFKSFVGMQPIPIVYGMTIAEYAQMIYFEKWINEDSMPSLENADNKKFDFIIVPCENYTHNDKYVLPIKPSPNLATMQAIYLYPSICLMEGTKASVGRGTDFPFELYGYPSYPKEDAFLFIPQSKNGAKSPPYLNQACYGKFLSKYSFDTDSYFTLTWLLDAWRGYGNQESFFDKSFFNLLAGNNQLMKDILAGNEEKQIRQSWNEKLNEFKAIRKKYLLYPDFSN